MKNLAITLTTLAIACTIFGQEQKPEQKLSADQIINKANIASYYSGEDGRSDVDMTITDASGKVRTRKFTVLRMNMKKGGDQKFYVYFESPGDVRKMAYMVWKNSKKNGNDDRWLYLPSTNLIRRIAPGDKRTQFVGSDFVYEDVSGRNPSSDRHELIKTDEKFYYIKSTPIDPAEVEFSYYDILIDKKTFLPAKAEYYNKNGKKYRIVEATKITEIQGFPTVIESRVNDLTTGSTTTNVFSNIKYNIKLTERIFSERFLRRPPREIK